MKKLLCFFVAIMLLLTFCGCKKTPPENVMVSAPAMENTENKGDLSNTPAPKKEENTKKAEEGKTQEKPVDKTPTKAPQPVDNTEEKTDKAYVTITISCKKALENYDKLEDEAKDSRIVPESGEILPKTKVELKEGETVFDVLKKVCMDKKIHMESSYTPVFKSAYIEGINNLYEFQCGSLSGWMYSVGGEFVGHGSSTHVLKEGDNIVFAYTCDLGRDLK